MAVHTDSVNQCQCCFLGCIGCCALKASHCLASCKERSCFCSVSILHVSLQCTLYLYSSKSGFEDLKMLLKYCKSYKNILRVYLNRLFQFSRLSLIEGGFGTWPLWYRVGLLCPALYPLSKTPMRQSHILLLLLLTHYLLLLIYVQGELANFLVTFNLREFFP